MKKLVASVMLVLPCLLSPPTALAQAHDRLT